MLFVVAASDKQWNEVTALRPDIDWQRVEDSAAFTQYVNADGFFSLKDSIILPEFNFLSNPVLIHSVVQTLADLNAPAHVYRINGWATFLNRTAWEICGNANAAIEAIFSKLNTKLNFVKDEPGFISARIIAMIINEAHFTIEDDVSSKAEIDTAMKLGTNYPYGPFEWAQLIGANNILSLLQKLNITDARYQPSPFLIKEVTENKE